MWVWHSSCRCGIKGPLPTHGLVSLAPGKVAHVTCECGWTGIGTYAQREDEEDLGDDFQKDVAADAARDTYHEHRLSRVQTGLPLPMPRQAGLPGDPR